MHPDVSALGPLLALGYTPRQAQWLQHVMTFAGAFLRRQFVAHLAMRKSGGHDQRLLSQLVERRHAIAVPYHGNERIYHVRSRSLYAAIGAEHSRLRRALRPLQTLQGLLVLDYLTLEPGTYLASETEKRTCLTRQFGVPAEQLPGRVYTSALDATKTTRHDFVERYPIGLCDEGLRIVVPDLAPQRAAIFQAFLADYRAVLQTVPRVEIVYLTGRRERATTAERLYRNACVRAARAVSPDDIEALHAYFETRRALDEHAYGRLSKGALDRHQEDVRRFADARYADLYPHWLRGGIVALTRAAHAEPLTASRSTFRHVALPWRYYDLGVPSAMAARPTAGRRER